MNGVVEDCGGDRGRPGKIEAGADNEEYLNRWTEVKGFHLGMETYHPAFTSPDLWGMFYYPHFMEEASQEESGV